MSRPPRHRLALRLPGRLRAAALAALTLLGSACTEQVSCAENPDLPACSPWICCTEPSRAGCDAAEVARRCMADAGRQDAGPCGGSCTGATPVCLTSTNLCVECTAEEPSACTGATPLCDEASNRCVGCASDADCTDPSAARCEAGACAPCEASAECAGVAGGLGVCEAGACVECTAADESACGTDSCDPVAQACTETERGSLRVCEACLADSECRDGQRCVPMRHGVGAALIGHFCAWRQDASGAGAPDGDCLANVAPYVSARSETSRSGQSDTFCVLRTSTCPAHADFSETACMAGVNLSAGPVAEPACGAEGVADGFCARASGETTNLCTVGCSSDLDCPCVDGSCAAQHACNDGFCGFGT